MVGSLMLRGWLIAAVTLSLLACAPSPERVDEEPKAVQTEVREDGKSAVAPKPKPVKKEQPAPVAKPVRAQQDYEVLPKASDVRIFVYRTGRLASQVGHNHVISSPDVQGAVVLTRDLVGSTVDIRVPVATLVVDNPAHRKEAGGGFDTKLSETDIENTRRNMLSSRVLDAGPYPLVRLKATVTAGAPPDMQASVSLTLHGKDRQFQTPVKVEKQGKLATATGEFSILQSDFGIEPISMLGGSLSVKDEVRIQYRIVAKSKE